MRIIISVLALIALIWLSPIFLSLQTGLRLGLPYRVFFTLFVLFAGAFFYLLRSPPMSPFKSTRRALATVFIVFAASVGFIVLLSNLAPQFAFESAASATANAGEKGKAIFNDPNMGCFLCHTINGAGGTRGPNLSHVASIASQRRPGMSAEDYLRESINNPGAYVVPTFDNIMPPISQRLSAEELNNLIEYLKTLK